MESEANKPETPATFLTSLGESLRKQEGADVDLIDILRDHILKASPAQNAVALAKAAIIELARTRANPHEKEGANG